MREFGPTYPDRISPLNVNEQASNVGSEDLGRMYLEVVAVSIYVGRAEWRSSQTVRNRKIGGRAETKMDPQLTARLCARGSAQ